MSASDWSAGLAARFVDLPFSELALLKITGLLVVAWIAHRALARANPRWRVLLWRGAAIAVVLGPVWMRFGPAMIVSIAEPRTPVENASTTAVPLIPSRSAPGAMVAEDADGARIDRGKSRPGNGSPRPSTPTAAGPAKASPEPLAVALTDAHPSVATNRWATFGTVLVRVIWLIGFVLVAVRTVVGHWRVAHLLSTALPAPDWILQICSRVIRELPCRNRVDLVVSSRAQVPFLCGLWRQRIVVPEKFCDRRFEHDLPAIFAHELAHARSHDVWWNTVLRIEAAALWFHPLAWRIPYAHAASCEDVGDAVSATYVGDARFYSRVLARVALEILSRPSATAVAMARTAEISRRLDALERTVPHRSVPLWALIATASVCVAVVLGAASLQLALAKPTPAPNAAPTTAATSVPAKTTEQDAKHAETLNRVLTAWKARQERLKTLHVTWKSRLLLSKGYDYSDARQWPIAGIDPDEERFRVADRFECQIPPSELWADERGRMRDDLTVARSHALKEPKPVVSVRTVTDGITHSRLVTPLSSEAPFMTIWREATPSSYNEGGMYAPQAYERRNRQAELMPLMLSLRPQSPAAGIAARACRVVQDNAVLDNMHCIKIRMESSQPVFPGKRRDPKDDNADIFWVDPARDYAIVLWERNWRKVQPGSFVITVRIDYQRDERFGWIPSHWESRIKGGSRNSALAIVDASVTRASINESLPRDTFAHAAPPRTRVYDFTLDQDLTAKLAAEAAKPPQLPDASMNAIVAAWTRRQTRIQSFHFTWQKNWSYYYRYDDNNKPRPMDHAETQEFRSNDSQWLDGPRLAIEQSVLECPDHVNLMRTLKSAYDGEATRTFFADTKDEPGAGKVRKGFAPLWFKTSDGHHLLLALRTALSNHSDINPSICRVLPITAKIGDVDCTLLHTKNRYGYDAFYWLDPARDYLVLREHSMADGRDIDRTDYSYRADAKVGWVPEGWTRMELSNYGCFVRSSTSKVTQYAVNEPLPPSAFQVKFPSGTGTFQDGGP